MTCKTFFCGLLLAWSLNAWSQKDEGKAAAGADSNSVNSLLSLSKENFSKDSAKAISYSLQAKELAEKIHFPKGVALALKNIGIVYYLNSNYLEAMDYYNQSLKVFQTMNDDVGVSNLLSNIGAVYMKQLDEAKALDYYLKSLTYAEKAGDKLRIVTALINIGAVYGHKKGSQDTALSYELRALPLAEELTNKSAIVTISINIGEVYIEQKKFTDARRYFEKALMAADNGEDSAAAFNSIGKAYMKQRTFDRALEFHQRAYALAKKINDQTSVVQALKGLGRTDLAGGNYKSAVTNFKKAEIIAKEINVPNDLIDVYKDISEAFDSLRDNENAKIYQIKYANLKDTIYNDAVQKQLAGLKFNYDLQAKEGQITLLRKDNEIRESELKVQESELRRQKLARRGLIIGLALAFILAIYIYSNYRKKAKMNRILDQQKDEIEGLLLNILPAEVAKELQTSGKATPRHYESVSVLFTDFKGFTALADKLPPAEVVKELNNCFMAFDNIVEKYGLEKIKTIGDSYMCAGGIPTYHKDHVCQMVKASLEMLGFIQKNNEERSKQGLPVWDIRVGIHVGPVVAGVVGKKKYAYDIWGSTVNIASRMESNGEPGMVNISAATYELIKHRYACNHRGKIHAKNVGHMDMYFVTNEITDRSQQEEVIPNSAFDSSKQSVQIPKI